MVSGFLTGLGFTLGVGAGVVVLLWALKWWLARQAKKED